MSESRSGGSTVVVVLATKELALLADSYRPSFPPRLAAKDLDLVRAAVAVRRAVG